MLWNPDAHAGVSFLYWRNLLVRLRAGLQEGLRGQSEAALWSTGGCFGLTSGSWDFFFFPHRGLLVCGELLVCISLRNTKAGNL